MIAAQEAEKETREREKVAARKRWLRGDFSKQEEESYVQAARPLWGLGYTDKEEEATRKVAHLAGMRAVEDYWEQERQGVACTRPTTATGAATPAAVPGPAANVAAGSAEGATAASKQLGSARGSSGGPPTDGEQWF